MNLVPLKWSFVIILFSSSSRILFSLLTKNESLFSTSITSSVTLSLLNSWFSSEFKIAFAKNFLEIFPLTLSPWKTPTDSIYLLFWQKRKLK